MLYNTGWVQSSFTVVSTWNRVHSYISLYELLLFSIPTPANLTLSNPVQRTVTQCKEACAPCTESKLWHKGGVEGEEGSSAVKVLGPLPGICCGPYCWLHPLLEAENFLTFSPCFPLDRGIGALGKGGQEFKPPLHHLLAVWFTVSYMTSLCLISSSVKGG